MHRVINGFLHFIGENCAKQFALVCKKQISTSALTKRIALPQIYAMWIFTKVRFVFIAFLMFDFNHFLYELCMFARVFLSQLRSHTFPLHLICFACMVFFLCVLQINEYVRFNNDFGIFCFVWYLINNTDCAENLVWGCCRCCSVTLVSNYYSTYNIPPTDISFSNFSAPKTNASVVFVLFVLCLERLLVCEWLTWRQSYYLRYERCWSFMLSVFFICIWYG